MSGNVPEDPKRAAYRTLADRIEDAPQPEVWDAFGEKMDTLAREMADDHAVAGYAMSVSTDLIGTDAPLGRVITVGYRQFGGSRDMLRANTVARNADVYALRDTSVSNPVEVARRSVVRALRRAADE